MSSASPDPSRSDLTGQSTSYLYVMKVLNSFQCKQMYFFTTLSQQSSQNPINECILQAISIDKTRVVSGLCSCTKADIKIIFFLWEQQVSNFSYCPCSDFSLQLFSSSFIQSKVAFEISIIPELHIDFCFTQYPLILSSFSQLPFSSQYCISVSSLQLSSSSVFSVCPHYCSILPSIDISS